ncbi:MAG: hypothetical protein ABIN48_04905 [Ginsengibacter sp.]
MKRLFVLLTILGLGTYLMMTEKEKKNTKKKAHKAKKTLSEFTHKAKEL